ncbi:MAG: metal-dependent hydrolase family protein [Planctomycetota bacterium]|jgi:imidazolonepropionase-like amidohydrolase
MLILSNISRLYDGTSADQAAVHTGVDLHVDDGRIAQLRPHDPALAVGDGHTLVDCKGLTVTPGMIDCHGHITVLGLAQPAMDTMLGGGALLYVEKILHTTLVDGGVTTMRDIGGATHLMKRMVDEGLIIGPRLKIAICMLSTTGGHADFRGPDRCHGELSRLWPAAPGRPSSIVDGPWEARKRVREIAACGADLIKICASPGVASPGDALEHRDFTAEEIAAITDEANARGLRVAAHAHSRSGIALAIENGVNDIQHISFMDEDLAERAYRKGCTVTPTSWVTAELPDAHGLSSFVMEKVKQVAEVHQRAVQYAAQGGLKILAGTDPVLPRMHGRNFLEIAHLVRDGLSPLAAWHGATGLAAQEIGQTDAGTLAAGQRADLLLCKGDVIEQPALLDDGALLEVMQDGLGHRDGVQGVPQRTFHSTVAAALGAES